MMKTGRAASNAGLLSHATRVAPDAPLSLWVLDLSAPPASDAIARLSDREHRRAAKFVFQHHRDRYLNAHIAVRLLLEEHCGIPPQRQDFILGTNGKPQLANLPDWQFSLSYAGDFALVGVDFGHYIGVDMERDRPIPDAGELIALHFHPHETEAMAALARPACKGAAFLQGWTRKEACLKALGCGLAMAPTHIHSRLADPLHLSIDDSIDLALDSFRPLPGFTAAWARVTQCRDARNQ
jgi:4'-phosphopantetheinyl transferase